MKKVFHNSLHDWAVPKDLTEPFYVYTSHVALSELELEVSSILKSLKSFKGQYSLHVEFSEPNTDRKFVLGYVSAVITILAETQEISNAIRKYAFDC
jgi:hypothetical protein